MREQLLWVTFIAVPLQDVMDYAEVPLGQVAQVSQDP